MNSRTLSAVVSPRMGRVWSGATARASARVAFGVLAPPSEVRYTRSVISPRLILCLLVLFTAACSDDGGKRDEAPKELGIADYCAVFHAALCEQQVSCNVELVNQATSIDQCVADAGVLCEPRLLTWIDSVEAGSATFEVEQLATCRDDIAALGCKDLAAGVRPRSCRQIFLGDTPRREDCFTDVECDGNDICANNGRCPGQCAAPLEDPDAFDCGIAGCPVDQWCTGSGCEPQKNQNEPCAGDDEQCLDGLFCGKSTDDGTLRCRTLRGIGEPCELRTNCGDGLSCHYENVELRERYCRAERGTREDCIDSNECARGLICNQADNKCAAPRQDQESCYDPNDCAEGLYCWEEFDPDPLLGVCREEFKVGIAAGEPCNPAIDRCRLGLYCEITDIAVPQVGECSVLPTLDQNCADFSRNLNEQCREGSCIELEDGQFICRPKGDAGTACVVKDECLSTVCLDGRCAAFDEVYCTVGKE